MHNRSSVKHRTLFVRQDEVTGALFKDKSARQGYVIAAIEFQQGERYE